MPTSHDVFRLGRCGGAVVQHLRDAFHLPARGGSVSKARRRVITQLREWGVDERARADAELVVSELFTNAVRHTDSVKVSCEVRVIGARLRVEVTDQGRAETEPRPRQADAIGEEGGRGLLLVGALSADWGVRVDRTGGGKVFWADLRYSSLASL
ncbi:ATP-binding protein [Streptomyces meridianus]|uniref:ATP-binding protein n=1 Tax=Streptomyces meridianus TaxID=2938945 RepID=A0ABT0XEM9_9ACTN|nr:ATP-binding protein [Streptomyces meridianus]MCM2580398.1 ATP-binding protein [Streptomyces meridianus]